MAAEIEFVPHDDRGREILDQLENETGKLPFKTQVAQGVRTYYLESAGTDGFDAILGRIAPDWREHLSRTS